MATKPFNGSVTITSWWQYSDDWRTVANASYWRSIGVMKDYSVLAMKPVQWPILILSNYSTKWQWLTIDITMTVMQWLGGEAGLTGNCNVGDYSNYLFYSASGQWRLTLWAKLTMTVLAAQPIQCQLLLCSSRLTLRQWHCDWLWRCGNDTVLTIDLQLMTWPMPYCWYYQYWWPMRIWPAWRYYW